MTGARRSLRERISLSVIAVFLVSMPIAAGATLVLGVVNSRAAAARESLKLDGFVSSALAQALWEIDGPRVGSISRTIVEDWNISSLRVSDDRTELFSFGADSPLPREKERTLRLERNGVFIGSVSYSIDSRPYMRMAVESAAGLTAALLLLLAFVLAALRKSVLHELRGPLDEIALLVSSLGSAAADRSPESGLRFVEFDGLRELLVRMRETIDRQIGELEASLRERDLLMREINHRVKNNLQLLAAIIDQQAETGSQDKRVLEKLLGRIESIASVYEQLWNAKRLNGVKMDDYLSDIAEAIGSSPRRSGILVDLALEPLYFSLDYAMSCGLIAHELLDNAAEYAYGGASGPVELSLGREGGRVALVVSDRGKGCPSDFRAPPPDGLGFRFVAALADQMEAEVVQEGVSGCRFSVSFDAAAAEAESGRELYSS